MTDSHEPGQENIPQTGDTAGSVDPGPAQGSSTPPPPPAADASSTAASAVSATAPKKSKKKVFIALSAVAALVLGVVVVGAVTGGSSSSNKEHIVLALDPRGTGAYYSVTMKDGKAVVGARLSSQDLGMLDVRESLDDNESHSTNIVALDKKTILLMQYPEGDDEDSIEFLAVDIETAQSTRLFSSDDGGQGIYVASEKMLYVHDDTDCFKVTTEGISTRIGKGRCYVGSGRVSAVSEEDESISFVYLDDEGNAAPPVNISVSEVNRFSPDRSVMWGRTDSNEVVVYDTLTGKQLWRYGDDDTLVSILDASTDGSSLLATIDDMSDGDSQVDIAVVKDVDGSYTVNVVTSAYKAGGAIAPDGNGVLVFTQKVEDSSGTLQYYGTDLKTPKSVASQVTIEDIGVSPGGAAVIVTDSQVYTGTFSSGFEQKVNGKFTNIYDDNFFSFRGSDALVMNLVGAEEGGGDNQIVYLPAPLATDGSTNSVVVASGDPKPYLMNNQSFRRDSRIIYGTKSDDYVILNERELTKDATSSRLVEGRISEFFQVVGDELTYFESTGSDRFTTYSLKGTDAAEREVVAEGYFILRVPVGDSGSDLEELAWNYYSSVAQIDDDMDECRTSGYPIIRQGSNARVEIKIIYTNDYDWTYFCVQNAGQGVTTFVSTSDSDSNTAGRPLWMRLNCFDKDNNSNDYFDTRETASQGGNGPSGSYTSPSNGSYSTCRIADNAYHGGGGSSYSVGGSVLVSVSGGE